MVGEFLRMLILLTAVPLMLWFARNDPNQASSLVGIAACAVLLVSLISAWGNKLLRIVVLFSFMVAVYLAGIDTLPWIALLVCLVVAVISECHEWWRLHRSKQSYVPQAD